MKIIVEVDNHIKDDEIIIKCREEDSLIKEIVKYANSKSDMKLKFYQRDQEYYFSLDEIIFFETEENSICAHTINNLYYVKYKLYELEKVLPKNFVRVSKSTIVNISHIYSINKKITSSRVIEFCKTHKQVFVSRFYYKNLKERLKEKN